jgi:hypothetical protein
MKEASGATGYPEEREVVHEALHFGSCGSGTYGGDDGGYGRTSFC